MDTTCIMRVSRGDIDDILADTHRLRLIWVRPTLETGPPRTMVRRQRGQAVAK